MIASFITMLAAFVWIIILAMVGVVVLGIKTAKKYPEKSGDAAKLAGNFVKDWMLKR